MSKGFVRQKAVIEIALTVSWIAFEKISQKR